MRKLLSLLLTALMMSCEPNRRYVVISNNYKDTDTVYECDYYMSRFKDEHAITFETANGDILIHNVNKIIAK